MLNSTTFIVKFPEFASTDTTLLQAHLTDAYLQLDASVWGLLLDVAAGYLTAHTLALSPFGQNARMIAKDGTTTYETHLKRLKLGHTAGFRVAL